MNKLNSIGSLLTANVMLSRITYAVVNSEPIKALFYQKLSGQDLLQVNAGVKACIVKPFKGASVLEAFKKARGINPRNTQ